MTDQLRIALLGGLHITRGGSPLCDFTSKKSAALLSYLATTARPHTREAISGLLWGDSSEDRARASLRTVLWDLRQHVAPFLVIDRQRVAFDQDSPHWLDVAEFSHRIETTLSHPANAGQEERGNALTDNQVDALQAAVSLYLGDFMAGFYVSDAPDFEEWVVKKREWARQLAMQALHCLVAHYTAQGTYLTGIDTATRLLEIAPWKEEAHRQLMRLLALGGQRGAALAQYETCRHSLAKELGVEPTVETQLLYQRIQAGEPLRGQEETHSTPSPPRRSPPRHNLPPRATAFVDRQDELAQLGRRLLDPAHRLLTLAGPDGIGKTRLALAAGQSAVGAFEHGVWFVPLTTDDIEISVGLFRLDRVTRGEREGHSTSSPALPLDIARALHVTFTAASPPATQLLDYLRHRRMLLILDDAQPTTAQIDGINDILRRAPYVTLLVTSRRPLSAPDEYLLRLARLPVPPSPARRSPEDALAFGSVQLFSERARRAWGSFKLDANDAHDVVRICEVVQGIPLAIELAAAWVDRLSPAAIARSLQRGVGRIADAQPEIPGYLRSVRAAFAHAWQQLSQPAQLSLARLAVFQDTFTCDAASAVAGITSPDLNVLVERSLLHRPAAGRYAWHPLLRQLALEQLEEMARGVEGSSGAEDRSTHAEAIGACHRDYYLDLVARSAPSLHGPQPQTPLAEIRREWGNVRLAWQRAVADASVHLLVRSLSGLSRSLLLAGPFREGEDLFGAAARSLRDDPRVLEHSQGPELLGRLWVEQARLMNEQARHDQALGAARKALDLIRAHGLSDLPLGAAVRREWGKALSSRGDYTAASAQLGQALAQARDAGAADLEAGCLHRLGIIALLQERYAQARAGLEPALHHYQAAGDRRGEANVVNDLGIVALEERRYAAARSHLQQALHLFQAISDRRGTGAAHNALGRLAIARGEYPVAAAHCDQALGIAHDLGDQQGEAQALTSCALLLLHEGQDEAAWNRSLQAAELARSLGDRATEGRALTVLGHTFMELEMPTQAGRAYQQALHLQRELGQPNLAAESLAGLASISLAQGDTAQAQAAVEEILTQLGTGGLKGANEPIRVYLTCYQILQANGDPRAAEVLSAASSIFDHLSRVPGS
jgi:DNA-binding SARP family transcriptional activator/predicted ATPase